MRQQRQPKRQRRSAQDWRELIAELSRSGKSVKDFASEQRLSPTTLSWWRWRLGGMAGDARAPAKSAPEVEPLKLLPIEVLADGEADAAGWEVRFASGHELRVRGGLGAAQLEELLRALLDGGSNK